MAVGQGSAQALSAYRHMADAMTEAASAQCSRGPLEKAARIAGLWPRLWSAMALPSYHHFQALADLEYSIIDYQGISAVFSQFALECWLRPDKTVCALTDLSVRSLSLFGSVLDGSRPQDGPDRGVADKRFKDRAWAESVEFRLLKDFYGLYVDWLCELARGAESLGPEDKRKLIFFTRQLVSALCPVNLALTNPQVLVRTIETGAENLISGAEHLLHDLEKDEGWLAITQTKEGAFEVGRDLALTAGKVVYRNDLIELIQYEPLTEQVFKSPILFVPPWINKYYVLDLRAENSFLRWLVERGHTVFVISWANPSQRHAGKNFESYMHEGPLTALRVVQDISGEDEINLGGFCIGGTLSVCTLAHLWAKGKAPIRSATFLASMVDFKDIGDCKVFIDEAQLANIAKHAQRKGYLAGYHLKDMFSLLKENDLVWNYVVNNYLMGRTPVAFDILHWNADPTRLPARMLIDYLRNFCLDNRLVEPGGLVLGEESIDLRRIRTPSYFISTKDDHIAPWKATYPATQLFAGPVTFVLGGSGHIAGIVNPPAKKKYGYWTSRDRAPDPDAWLEGAKWTNGSWWPHWSRWLARHSGEKVPARRPGSNAFPPLYDAPGHFVLER